MLIRDATPADFTAVVQLNLAEVQHTSAMDLQRLQWLDSIACYHRIAEVDGQVAGFLFAMDETAAYPNDNFQWFSARYPRFIYIDRIVISKAHSGKKIGSLFYQDLANFARQRQTNTLLCEFNLQPANPPSEAFHRKQGFQEVGQQQLKNPVKLVSLQALTL